MAVDITINGTFRMHASTRTPSEVWIFPRADFYLGAVAITASSPFDGGQPYKTVAVTAVAGAGGNVGTTVYSFTVILPSTVDADVNPVDARWGAFVYDDSDVPRLISEISDLETFFLLTTPTTLSLLDVRAQQGTSTPWPPSGGDQTVTGVLTVTGNLIVGGNVNGRDPDNFVDGTGTALAYPLWTDTNTLQNGYLKQETDVVSMTGTAGNPAFRLWTNGVVGDANYTRGVLKADVNVVQLTAERGGTFSAQATAVRLGAMGSAGLVQIARDGTVKWTFDGATLEPNTGGTHNIGTGALPLSEINLASTAGGIRFYNSSVEQLTLQVDAVDTLSMYDSDLLQFARFNYGPSIHLQAGSGSPEGVVTANIGSLYSRTNGGANTSLYVKESGTGNTGWVAK